LGLRDFIESSKRVLIVSKKPTKEEYLLLAKITLIGVLLLGALGFIIALLFLYLGFTKVV